jgi:hypothetical protein
MFYVVYLPGEQAFIETMNLSERSIPECLRAGLQGSEFGVWGLRDWKDGRIGGHYWATIDFLLLAKRACLIMRFI